MHRDNVALFSSSKLLRRKRWRAHNPRQEESVKQDVFPPWRLRDITFKYAAGNLWNWQMSAQKGRAEIGRFFFPILGVKNGRQSEEQTKWIMKTQINIYNRILDPWSPARQQLRTVFVSLCQFPKRHSLLTAYLKNAISLSDRMTWWNDKWN